VLALWAEAEAKPLTPLGMTAERRRCQLLISLAEASEVLDAAARRMAAKWETVAAEKAEADCFQTPHPQAVVPKAQPA